MIKNVTRSILTLALISLLITACSQDEPDPTATPDVASTVAASLAATQTAQAPTPTVEESSAPAADGAATCTVVIPSLRLRSGPSSQFDVVALLSQNDTLIVIGANPEGDWLLVESDVADEPNWVNASEEFVTCQGAIAAVSPELLPATPTFTPTSPPPAPDDPPTATLTPSPTPTPVALVVVPRTGGGDGDMQGDVMTDPRLFAGSNTNPVFREFLSLQIEVWLDDPDSPEEDGVGVEDVTIRILDPNGNEVYSVREEVPAYCLFGGNGPCNVLRLRAGDNWPGTDNRITNGDHTGQFEVEPKDSSREAGNWNVPFRIEIPGNAAATQGEIIAEFAQIGRNNLNTTVEDALVFQVSAYDSGVGTRDGNGIDEVEMVIFGPDNNRVYRGVEQNAGYCAFGGGEPYCNVFDLADNSHWPDNGDPIDEGTYTLQAKIFTTDGRSKTISQEIRIVRSQEGAAPSEIVAKLAQVGPNSTSATVSDALVIQVEAHDSAAGNSDGAGIDNVEFRILNDSGAEVYRQTESNAGYCAFGGGEPNCNVLSFNQNDDWPKDGPEITSGAYTLQVTINAESGAQETFSAVFQIDLE